MSDSENEVLKLRAVRVKDGIVGNNSYRLRRLIFGSVIKGKIKIDLPINFTSGVYQTLVEVDKKKIKEDEDFLKSPEIKELNRKFFKMRRLINEGKLGYNIDRRGKTHSSYLKAVLDNYNIEEVKIDTDEYLTRDDVKLLALEKDARTDLHYFESQRGRVKENKTYSKLPIIERTLPYIKMNDSDKLVKLTITTVSNPSKVIAENVFDNILNGVNDKDFELVGMETYKYGIDLFVRCKEDDLYDAYEIVRNSLEDYEDVLQTLGNQSLDDYEFLLRLGVIGFTNGKYYRDSSYNIMTKPSFDNLNSKNVDVKFSDNGLPMFENYEVS